MPTPIMFLSSYPQALVSGYFSRVMGQMAPHSISREIAHARLAVFDQSGSNNDSGKGSIDYASIETARWLLFGDQKNIQGVQLGCNFGPYLHYLKVACGIEGLVGIDQNPAAVEYARSIGAPVELGDIRDLSRFPDQSQELVVTHNLLDPLYLGFAIDPTLEEIDRILAPGGYHLSFFEQLPLKRISFHRHCMENFGPAVAQALPTFSFLDVRPKV
jgi:SAM-dependent methyltransferase